MFFICMKLLLVLYGRVLGIKTPNPNIKNKLKMGNQMVKEHTLTMMEKSMLENGRMGKNMVKEHTLIIMGLSMWGDGKIIKNTVKEHTLLLMETGLNGNGRMENHGTSQYTTKTETS